MPLRNITADLRDRLAAVEAQRKRLDSEERALRELLAAEEARWRDRSQPTLFTMHDPNKKTDVRRRHTTEPSANTSFLNHLLADGEVWHIEDIAHRAVDAGLEFGSKSPGRVLHFVLVGMKQRGLVEQVGSGSWRGLGKSGRGDAMTN